MNRTYTRLKAGANRLLTRLGTRATLRTIGGEEITGYAALIDSETTEAGTTQEANRKTVFFQGTEAVSPSPGDLISVGDDNWGIVKVKDYNPDGKMNIVFEFEVAR